VTPSFSVDGGELLVPFGGERRRRKHRPPRARSFFFPVTGFKFLPASSALFKALPTPFAEIFFTGFLLTADGSRQIGYAFCPLSETWLPPSKSRKVFSIRFFMSSFFSEAQRFFPWYGPFSGRPIVNVRLRRRTLPGVRRFPSLDLSFQMFLQLSF